MIPRPEKRIWPKLLPTFERPGWIAQVKKNGDYSIITTKDGIPSALNRHGSPHKHWEFSEETKAFFSGLPDSTICAELLNVRTKGGPKDVHYIHDITMFRERKDRHSRSLLGTTYQHRYNILWDMFKERTSGDRMGKGYYILDPHFWLARNYESKFLELFQGLTDPEDEGVVCKDTNAVWFGNNDWSVKARRPHKNFSS